MNQRTDNFADTAANMEAEVNHLRSKSDQDDTMILLLKRQLETREMEIAKMVNDHSEEVRQLRSRCDLAVRREKEISGILNTAATGIMQGLRKMKGDDESPPVKQVTHDARAPIVGHSLLPEVIPPATEPASVRPSPPREVAQFAPPIRLARPAVEDTIDDGLAALVHNLPRSLARETHR